MHNPLSALASPRTRRRSGLGALRQATTKSREFAKCRAHGRRTPLPRDARLSSQVTVLSRDGTCRSRSSRIGPRVAFPGESRAGAQRLRDTRERSRSHARTPATFNGRSTMTTLQQIRLPCPVCETHFASLAGGRAELRVSGAVTSARIVRPEHASVSRARLRVLRLRRAHRPVQSLRRGHVRPAGSRLVRVRAAAPCGAVDAAPASRGLGEVRELRRSVR